MRRVLAIVALSSFGCGGTVVESPAVDAGGDSSPSDTAVADAGFDCSKVCGGRAAKAKSEGWCEPLLAGDAGFVPCGTYCAEHAAAWTAAERAAFTTCAETDPLCFLTIEQCVAR